MLSYTALRNLFGNLVSDSSSGTLTVADRLINDSYRLLTSSRDWDFLQKTATDSTVASQQFYNLPDDYDQLVNVTILVGTYLYTPRECPSRVLWDQLNVSTQYTTNYPEWFFIFNGTIGYYPIPSASVSNNVTYTYRQKVNDLSIADYATGTVTSVANAGTAVVGSGTTWTAPMKSRYIQVPASNTASSSGDSAWYPISTVPSATSITLARPYQGLAISAATASYAIGQMPILPEPYHPLPVYRAAQIFFSSIQPEMDRADRYKALYEELYSRLLADYGPKTTNVSLDDERRNIVNPNLFIQY